MAIEVEDGWLKYAVQGIGTWAGQSKILGSPLDIKSYITIAKNQRIIFLNRIK